MICFICISPNHKLSAESWNKHILSVTLWRLPCRALVSRDHSSCLLFPPWVRDLPVVILHSWSALHESKVRQRFKHFPLLPETWPFLNDLPALKRKNSWNPDTPWVTKGTPRLNHWYPYIPRPAISGSQRYPPHKQFQVPRYPKISNFWYPDIPRLAISGTYLKLLFEHLYPSQQLLLLLTAWRVCGKFGREALYQLLPISPSDKKEADEVILAPCE